MILQVLQSQELKFNWSVLANCNATHESLQALCQYEKTMHTNVFLPAWKSVKVYDNDISSMKVIDFLCVVSRALYSIWRACLSSYEVKYSLY